MTLTGGTESQTGYLYWLVVAVAVAVSRTMPRLLHSPYRVISLLTLGLREVEDDQLGHSVLVCMHLPITREISATLSRHGGFEGATN